MDDSQIEQGAVEFARQNKKRIAKETLEKSGCESQSSPAAIFMAGVPGAGKTEISKRLVDEFKSKPVRIDIDELRELLPDYDGHKAYLFQQAATILQEAIYDLITHKNINFILDSTLAKGKTVDSLTRAMKHRYICTVYYIYQDPVLAWNFTREREKLERRAVPRAEFVDAYFRSREHVDALKHNFGKELNVNLIIKDYEKGLTDLRINIDSIDGHLPKLYNRDELERLLPQ